MAGSISGLASGLDTATIINQLMQLEAASQNRLKAKVASETNVRSVLQALNTKIASIATRAAELAKPSTWTALTASVTGTAVTANATSGAAAGTYEITVNQKAVAHQHTFTQTAAMATQIVADGRSLILETADGPVTVNTGTGSLRDVITGLNAPGTGVRASTVVLDDGTHRLRVEARDTGSAAAFTLRLDDDSDLLAGSSVRTGQNASISIGGDTVTSATNTFTAPLSGVSLTLAADAVAGDTAVVTVAPDTAAMVKNVKGLIDAVNLALADIDFQSKAGGTGKAGPLAGDANVRSLRTALLSSVYPIDGTSLADLGIQLDRTGRIQFNEEKFTAAYEADRSAVTARFAAGARPADLAEGVVHDPGFAGRLEALAKRESNSIDGTLTLAAQGRSTAIRQLEDSIFAWDRRLDLRRTNLTRQFTALETALSQMNSQSNWLAGQIGSMRANNL